MAASRGIYIWDIKKNGDSLNFKVRSSSYKALDTISKENGLDLHITEKQGLPFYSILFRRRMGFFTGALIFIVALYIMSSFIWFVEVTGNENVEKSKIIAYCSQVRSISRSCQMEFQPYRSRRDHFKRA
jgi:similar to stage IV sporulation protein